MDEVLFSITIHKTFGIGLVIGYVFGFCVGAIAVYRIR